MLEHHTPPKRDSSTRNKDREQMMRIDELHKFSDGTLDDVRTALNDRLKGIRMEYLPQTFLSQRDKANARAMIQAIDKRLKTRRIMRSLERFVDSILQADGYPAQEILLKLNLLITGTLKDRICPDIFLSPVLLLVMIVVSVAVIVVVVVIVVGVSLVVFPFPFIAFTDSCSPTLNCLLDQFTGHDGWHHAELQALKEVIFP
ncbi:hypothetical protein Tco_0463093 [Tanacetum coccineum]